MGSNVCCCIVGKKDTIEFIDQKEVPSVETFQPKIITLNKIENELNDSNSFKNLSQTENKNEVFTMCKDVADVIHYLESKLTFLKQNEFDLAFNFILLSKYMLKVLKMEFFVENIPVILSTIKGKRLGVYNGYNIMINRNIYESNQSDDIITACRNVTHELVHVLSDFMDMKQRPFLNLKESRIFDIRRKMKFLARYSKRRLGLTNAKILKPKTNEFLRKNLFGSVEESFTGFPQIQRYFRDCFSIPNSEKSNFMEEMLAYSLCGTNSKSGIIHALTYNQKVENLSSKIPRFYENLLNSERDEEEQKGDFSFIKRDIHSLIRILFNVFRDFSVIFQKSFLELYGGNDTNFLAKLHLEYEELVRSLQNLLDNADEWHYEKIKMDDEKIIMSSTFCELKDTNL